jgi:NAD(P)-dependent dehydrogenase (short-subunit alcohol dehydrogenase family)
VIINLVTGLPSDTSPKAAFLASMSGLEAFTRQAARELSPYGIQVYPVWNVQGKIIETVFALLGLQMEER